MTGTTAALTLLLLAGAVSGCSGGSEESESPEAAFTADDLPGESSTAPLDASGWRAYSEANVPVTAWDADQSGRIERAEFDKARRIGLTADTTFERWDADRSGGLEGEEWSGAWFEIHDDNRDGIISPEELEEERFRRR